MREQLYSSFEPERERQGLDLTPEIEERFDHMKEALYKYVDNPIEKDPRIRDFRLALLESINNGDELIVRAFANHFKGKANNLNHGHEPIPPIYPSNLALRAFQKVLMGKHNNPPGLSYPRQFTNPETWKIGMRHVLEHDLLKNDFTYCFNFLPIQSNVADRYKSLKLILNGYKERFHEQPRVIDIGCSQNHGLQTIADNLNFFSDTRLITAAEQPQGVTHKRLAKALVRILSRPSPLGSGTGVDLYTPEDINISRWIASCSFYPTELLDQKRVKHFNRLTERTRTPLANINFVWNDFVDPAPAITTRVNTIVPGPKSMDIAMASTVMYELPKDKQERMLQRMLEVTADDGLVVVQDFVFVDPGEAHKLRFDAWYDPQFKDSLPYKTYILDKTQPGKGFQPFMQWTSGRCTEVKLEPLAYEALARTI